MGPPGFQESGASGGGSGDTSVEDSRRPIMIAVVGKAGAGKMSFTNAITGMSLVVGHDINSCAQEIQLASATLCGRSVTFIDTPGFGDDLETVISQCLQAAATSEGGATISGVIYPHPITDPDAESSSRTKLDMFRKLCGGKFQNAVLCTTMWEKPGIAEGELLEQRLLREDPTLWRDMYGEGAPNRRHQGPDFGASARVIAEALVGRLAASQVQVESGNKAPLGASVGKLLEREEVKGKRTGEIEKLMVGLQAAINFPSSHQCLRALFMLAAEIALAAEMGEGLCGSGVYAG